ncbi:MAG: hypothetical protein EPN40_09705 [Rhodanobacteraceae bacterium]|nr:MAG: hypothetical protein EPN40_09705 [Rhodanobacteraceae bacterium]
MNIAISSTPPDPFPRAARIARILFLAALLPGIALPAALLIWQAATPEEAVRSADAGQFLSATGSNAFLQPALTNIETTHGSLIVNGLFSAPRGRALEVVKLNDKGGTYLCAAGDLDTCLPLAGAWAGTLAPTPNTNRVFDFERYGLADSNLWGWVACGVLACLLSGLAWFAVWATNSNQRDDDDPDQGDEGQAA